MICVTSAGEFRKRVIEIGALIRGQASGEIIGQRLRLLAQGHRGIPLCGRNVCAFRSDDVGLVDVDHLHAGVSDLLGRRIGFAAGIDGDGQARALEALMDHAVVFGAIGLAAEPLFLQFRGEAIEIERADIGRGRIVLGLAGTEGEFELGAVNAGGVEFVRRPPIVRELLGETEADRRFR